jgi:sulfur carrier protein ThiS
MTIVNCVKGKVTKMRVLYINNEGGGWADYVDVPEGKTVEQFFKDKMPGRAAADYLIRVNRQPVPRDYVLQENDRVTITPVKIEGAA